MVPRLWLKIEIVPSSNFRSKKLTKIHVNTSKKLTSVLYLNKNKQKKKSFKKIFFKKMVAEPPPRAMGVVRPPPNRKMWVAETTPKSLGGGSATPFWPEGGFGHPRSTDLRVAEPLPGPLGVVRPPLRAKP
jgi:hypothetical protein